MTLFQTLEDLAKRACEVCGVRFWGLEFRGNSATALLRVYIDSDEGIHIDQCEEVSRQLSDYLDLEDPIPQRYTLEVSSPGLNRAFFYPSQYADYLGHEIVVRLKERLNGRTQIQGRLQTASDREIEVLEGEVLHALPFSSILSARLKPFLHDSHD